MTPTRFRSACFGQFQTANTYDYFVINDTVEEAVRELDAIITAEHCKPKERMAILGE